MKHGRPSFPVLLAAMVVMALAFVVPDARADMLPSSYERTSVGTSGAGGTTTLAVPGSSNYGNSFSGGADGGTPIPSTSYGFFDDYIFEITGATANSVTSTISLGGAAGLQISGLQARLFQYDGVTPPPLGTPPSPPVVSWSTAFSNGEYAVIPDTMLLPGRYVLQVRGTVTGAAGGSYAGVLNLTPVPLPAALPLLGAGLGLFSAFGVRRRRKA